MRALLSVYDKTGVVDLARRLAAQGVELVSSGGTAAVIAAAGLSVTDVAEFTGVPAILGHRVVTLHPKVHGGLLADRTDQTHLADMADYDIAAIDLVVANLYPFSTDPGIELIDIGGPAMVRAAAKNHRFVGVVVDPADYDSVVAEIAASGSLSDHLRRRLARKAFAHTADYDAAIVAWFDQQDGATATAANDGVAPAATALPPTLHVSATRSEILRYGENPHQHGARYSITSGTLSSGVPSCWDAAEVLGGKEMSFLNVYDADAAWRLVWSLGERPAAVVIKHANPCGAAVADDISEAYRLAHACDEVSAYGGIVAVNRDVTLAIAEAIGPVFTEVLIAPGYEPAALELLQERKKNLRIIQAPPPRVPPLDIRSIDGGLLVQTADAVSFDRETFTVATERIPSDREWADLELAWRVAARVTSNTIVLAKDGQAVGIGAGQQNRRDAGRLAAEKAAGRAVGGACASDAFFPFRDGLDAAIEAGATAVIQPGGSIRDDEVIAAANEAGLAMVFTGERHFKH
jgi:phosphoribosylaminoimidazolecarboxamide formyltransferase/IMP cyclohydrolase